MDSSQLGEGTSAGGKKRRDASFQSLVSYQRIILSDHLRLPGRVGERVGVRILLSALQVEQTPSLSNQNNAELSGTLRNHPVSSNQIRQAPNLKNQGLGSKLALDVPRGGISGQSNSSDQYGCTAAYPTSAGSAGVGTNVARGLSRCRPAI